jgi:hypothetical protein
MRVETVYEEGDRFRLIRDVEGEYSVAVGTEGTAIDVDTHDYDWPVYIHWDGTPMFTAQWVRRADVAYIPLLDS